MRTHRILSKRRFSLRRERLLLDGPVERYCRNAREDERKEFVDIRSTAVTAGAHRATLHRVNVRKAR